MTMLTHAFARWLTRWTASLFLLTTAALLAQPRRKVHLVPLLLVAGDHSVNDMAGDEEDSLKRRLEAAGFTVSYSLRGLGEIPAVREMICRRVPAET